MKKLFITFLFLLSASIVQGQSINTTTYSNEGFYINASVLGVAWNVDDLNIETEAGAGIGLKIGYNFNPNLGIFASFDAASISPDNSDNYILGHLDIGIQGTFRSETDRFRPYLRGSFLGMSAQDDFIEINGAGFGFGVGGLLYLTEKLALDINYTHSFINLSEVKIDSVSFDVDENASTGRFFIGLTYHF